MSDKAVVFHAGNYLGLTERRTQKVTLMCTVKSLFPLSLKISPTVHTPTPNTGKANGWMMQLRCIQAIKPLPVYSLMSYTSFIYL